VNYTSAVSVRKPETEMPEPKTLNGVTAAGGPGSGDVTLAYLQLLWGHRALLLRASIYALLASVLVAFLIPARYESTAHLMPPDNQSSSGLAMAAAAMSGAAGGLGGLAGDLLGLKSTSDVFVGILGSRTVQDQLIKQFDLKKLYRDRRMEDARTDLAEHTAVAIDRKSQIISITVTDRNPQRAMAMAEAYVDELNRLVAELSTSSARRERVFLEERLQAVSRDLETAEKDFSQFASKNTAIDIKEQGRAMVEEVVFETLTKEDELAKVQEAKEIPAVKVLDTPNVPEKKSFPPRPLIIVAGTFAGLMATVAWIFASASWHATDASDPRKLFAQEVFCAVTAQMPGFSSGNGANGTSRLSRLERVGEERDGGAAGSNE